MRIRYGVLIVVLGVLSLLIWVAGSRTQIPVALPDNHERATRPPPPPGDRERGIRPPAPAPDMPGAGSAAERFRELDRDRDGVLSFDEMPDSLRAGRDRWDGNKDGHISLAEWTAFLESYLAQQRPPSASPRPAPAEPGRAVRVPGAAPFPSVARKAVSVARPPFDESRRSRPTADHRSTKFPKNLPAWFREYDEDGDGQVSLYEWKAKGDSLKEFKKYDLNGDGFITVGELIRSGQFTTNTKTPPNGHGLQGEVGDYFYLEVTAAGRGPVWGTDVYTADTSIAAAAVHAGVLQPGETRLIKVTLLPGQESYEGSVHHGITSHDFGAFPRSFRVDPLP